MGILTGAVAVTLIKEVAVPMIKKVFSKPSKGIKEAGIAVAVTSGVAIYEQANACGVDCIEAGSVATLASGLWVFIVRLYQKHKEDKSPNEL